MKKTQVLINRCFGGFGLSPEATLELYKLGAEGMDITPANEYSSDPERNKKYLDEWRAYQKEPDARKRGFLTVYSPDEKFAICATSVKRDDPNLIKVFKKLGLRANGNYASLKLVSIPAGIEWEIDEYDGLEKVEEKHKVWQ